MCINFPLMIEIRTPLNAVLGCTSLLAETVLTHEQEDYVRTVQVSGEHLLTVLNDILDFSKQEAGKFELEFIELDLQTTVEQAIEVSFRPKNDIELIYSIDKTVPQRIIGDQTRLRQILANLLSNAVKFTKSGYVKVSVRALTLEERLDRAALTSAASNPEPSIVEIEFAVEDTGIGIKADRMDRLFKSFSQVDSSTNRLYGGSGLGLAISCRLAQLMGGTMSVESEEGVGSTFYFTIQAKTVNIAISPKTQPTMDSEASASSGSNSTLKPNSSAFFGTLTSSYPESKAQLLFPQSPANSCSILVVDMNELLLSSLNSSLTDWGINPLCTNDTASALQLFQHNLQPNPQYIIVAILLGHSYKHFDSVAFAKEIRKINTDVPIMFALPTFADHPADSLLSPLAELPANNCDLAVEISQIPGNNSTFRKPILLNKLYHHLQAIFQAIKSNNKQPQLTKGLKKRSSSNTTTSTNSNTPHNQAENSAGGDLLSDKYPISILLAEDNPVNMKLAVKMLSSMGYSPAHGNLSLAVNGEEAIRFATDAQTKKHFDLILTDVLMPIADGYVVTSTILSYYHNNRAESPLPVIIAMTASSLDSDRKSCLCSGMLDHISKPISLHKLHEKIEQWSKTIWSEKQNRLNSQQSRAS
jgi:CheY-like chemotaxis protein